MSAARTQYQRCSTYVFLANVSKALCEYDKLISWDVVGFDGFGYDLFWLSVAVYICSIPGVETSVICGFKKWKRLLNPWVKVYVWLQVLWANLFFVKDPWLPICVSERHGTTTDISTLKRYKGKIISSHTVLGLKPWGRIFLASCIQPLKTREKIVKQLYVPFQWDWLIRPENEFNKWREATE
jgi:hypothetical protein